jgi:benzoate/toluate 1,2-dioxygenase alpha subunit
MKPFLLRLNDQVTNTAYSAMDDTSSYIEDRLDDGVFRIDRGIYTRPEIFEAEMDRVFGHTWVYLCHESQVSEYGDYYATDIGRQPVFVIRQEDGELGAFINACAHRGAILTPRRRGTMQTIACRFHGWCYNTKGDCTHVKNEETGWRNGSESAQQGLTPVPRVARYKGFIFGCLDADIEPLEEHLGETLPFIDHLADQSPEGLEVVRGGQTYMVRGNWKLNAETGVDGYHVSTVHKVFVKAMEKREQLGDNEDLRRTESGRLRGTQPAGCYDFGNGHNMIWSDRETPEVMPLYESEARLLEEYPKEKVDWMLRRGRNLYLFPNVHLMDQPSTQIRVTRPISPDRTEVRVYCIAPKGESRKARAARLRKFEDFYTVTGMATPDDLAALEDCQFGAAGTLSRWSNLDRGLGIALDGPDDAAKGIGANPISSGTTYDQETLYYGFFRKWRSLMGEIAN